MLSKKLIDKAKEILRRFPERHMPGMRNHLDLRTIDERRKLHRNARIEQILRAMHNQRRSSNSPDHLSPVVTLTPQSRCHSSAGCTVRSRRREDRSEFAVREPRRIESRRVLRMRSDVVDMK